MSDPTPPPVEEPQEPTEWTPPASQADLDRIIEGRLAREREKYKPLQEKAEKWDAFESSGVTDEKALEEATSRAVADTAQKFMQRMVTTEVRAQAARLGFNDPADALAVIGTDLPVKDDEPDAEAIQQLVEKLATEKPYLLTQTRRRPADRPKPRDGEPVGGETASGKGRAAAALRQLATSRKGIASS